MDATAAARPELRSRLPFTAVHRTVHRPQHFHGSSPSTLDARVPAIQRPSAQSHRTIDNSLITSRIEYSRSSSYRLHYQQKAQPFEVLVVDEAAQLKECESLIPLQLPGVRQAVLIGDERQLPALVKSKVTPFLCVLFHLP